MVKRLIPLALVAGVMALALVACGGGGATTPAATSQPSSPPAVPPATSPSTSQPGGSGGSSGASGGDTFTVNLQDPAGSGEYKFSPSDLTFSVGDTVTFTLTAEKEFHTFTVDDLNIDVSVTGGATVEHTVTFDRAGSFELICIPHERIGMTGTITVN